MKKGLFFAMAFAFSLIAITSFAQENKQTAEAKNQLGIRISSKAPAINNSVSYKRFIRPTTAIEGLFSFGDPVGLGVLVEKFQSIGDKGLTWFWGAGAYTGFSGGRNFGAQGVIGVDVVFPTVPINLSLDWKPELNFTKEFSFEPAALGLSARFVF